ncbi:MAG: hypothetical protein IKP71_02410 [Candidatus Riflebacteria bacterium]|nr:hypothetical protein [Candidatus Riflebacteria bacterium]
MIKTKKYGKIQAPQGFCQEIVLDDNDNQAALNWALELIKNQHKKSSDKSQN